MAFKTEFKVRDYELDMQGIVNNSVYGNYFEHARHEFLDSLGIDFAGLANSGIHLVVTKIEIEYKGSLNSGEQFIVTTECSRISRIRFKFEQKLYKPENNNKIVATATVCGVPVNGSTGRPSMPPELERILPTE